MPSIKEELVKSQELQESLLCLYIFVLVKYYKEKIIEHGSKTMETVRHSLFCGTNIVNSYEL